MLADLREDSLGVKTTKSQFCNLKILNFWEMDFLWCVRRLET